MLLGLARPAKVFFTLPSVKRIRQLQRASSVSYVTTFLTLLQTLISNFFQADITEVDKGPEKNEFSFKIHSKTHEFQAKDEAERDSWHAALESSMYHAKGIKEDLVSSGPYKDNHAAIGKFLHPSVGPSKSATS